MTLSMKLPALVDPIPDVRTERGITLAAYFRNCDFPVPGSPTNSMWHSPVEGKKKTASRSATTQETFFTFYSVFVGEKIFKNWTSLWLPTVLAVLLLASPREVYLMHIYKCFAPMQSRKNVCKKNCIYIFEIFQTPRPIYVHPTLKMSLTLLSLSVL